MKTALVLGVNGQDGSYLAQALLERGDSVVGMGRDAQERYDFGSDIFRYMSGDIGNPKSLAEVLSGTRPDEIYHLAAVHGAAQFTYEASWRDALNVNTGSVQTCLEYLRGRDDGRFFYASSLKAFGAPAPEAIDEKTPRRSTCLYSITKNASADLIDYYRRKFGTEAAIGYLFNHDSPRRPREFFLPKLTNQLSRALHGNSKVERASGTPLATLNFSCDWGSSPEYMDIAIDFMRARQPEDALFVTGRPWTGWGLAAALSQAAGITTEDWVCVDEPMNERIAAAPLAKPDRLWALSGRAPHDDALDVALWMLRENHGIQLEKPTVENFDK